MSVPALPPLLSWPLQWSPSTEKLFLIPQGFVTGIFACIVEAVDTSYASPFFPSCDNGAKRPPFSRLLPLLNTTPVWPDRERFASPLTKRSFFFVALFPHGHSRPMIPHIFLFSPDIQLIPLMLSLHLPFIDGRRPTARRIPLK